MIKEFKDDFSERYTLSILGPDGDGAVGFMIKSRDRKITYLCRVETLPSIIETLQGITSRDAR